MENTVKTNDPPIENLLSEYETVVAEAGFADSNLFWERLKRTLIDTSEWSDPAAEHLVMLARNYGSFALRNAYALAFALDIEDGELGI